MPICINPKCSTYNQNHPQNDGEIKCQFCDTDLLLKNRYWVTKLLSDNTGFGLIYLADNFGTPKILKVLQPHHNHNAKVVELFQKEAQILTSIKQQHPDLGIPTIDEYFNLPLGIQYIGYSELYCIVMEYVGNQDLSNVAKITDQKLALDYFKQIVNILHLIHQDNYFHRDIKPSNIMIFSSGKNEGKLCLIDFGSAREMTATYLGKIGENQRITQIISPGYTPPEQEKGQAIPQSDFYALGRTFVFLLTKIEPFDPLIYDVMNNSLNWRSYSENMSANFLYLIDCLMSEKAKERPKNTQEILDKLNIIEKNIYVPPTTSVNTRPKINITLPKNRVNLPKKNHRLKFIWLFLLLLIGFGYYQYSINYNSPANNASRQLKAKDYYFRGLAKYYSKDYQGAIADYTKAINFDSNYTIAYNNRGWAKYYLKDYQGAIADYNQAINLDSNYTYAYNNRGLAKYYLKDYQRAIADYNQAINLDPNLALPYHNRGMAKNQLKDYQGAIADYNQAITLDPNYTYAYNNRGLAKYYLKDYQGAIADYNEAINLDPKYAWPYNNRGLIYERLGDKTQAINDFQKAAELNYEQRNEIDYQTAMNNLKRLQK